MKILILMQFLVVLISSGVPVNLESNFREEQFLMRDQKNDEQVLKEQVDEGSGSDIDDVLVPENSTTPTIPTSTTPFLTTKILTSSESPPTSTSTSTPHHLITTPARPIRCYDVSKRCMKVKPLCTRPEYQRIMMRQCAKTCNLCPQFARLPHTSRCRDAFHSCPIWARNGFCHSTYYTLQERTEFCRRSCQGC